MPSFNMAKHLVIWMLILSIILVQSGASEENHIEYMSKTERESLKEEARDMFYHAYNAYMDNAYPADELMPLTCKGRFRGSEADRGDIDSTLGNFSLTLVDTLDTLVVLGDLGEFENAVKLVVKDVSFDTDVIVSLFETNIRMLGGLLSGHILAEYLQLRADIMPWYRGELLNMAKDLGYRFLPAFNTTTGIPFGRINLMHGMKGVPLDMCRETCTACAGSMILEMAALSRLTGESIFEEKAQKAMDALWKMRHRGTDLMGSVLNVHSGDWVRRDSGVGAGIDSYYEYCLKAYILLGDEKYLGRFNRHYQAIMKYISQGPMLLDVHMHRPNTNSKNFMDALLAFWPGLQVLKGDIKPAVETHEMLYQVIQRHNFIPEAFTTDFQVHWGHHPLRPEFLESTYFLYRATGDHYYLGVGRKVLNSLQKYARVACGYAAVSDVRTNKHDDTMDSFVLSETFKYLFLLFAESNDLVLDLDEFIFTTEGHLLPLTLAAMRANISTEMDIDAVHVGDLDRTCPNSLHLFPASVRQPLRNMVEDVCPRRNSKRRLVASQFQANNLEHLKLLSNMGITILTTADGRMQLLHTFSNAKTVEDAEEGLMFMQEMVEINQKVQEQTETGRLTVTFKVLNVNPVKEVTMLGGPAQFGRKIRENSWITGKPVFTEPSEACIKLKNPEVVKGNIAVVSRGNCMFFEKARMIQEAGAIAGIVLDTTIGSSVVTSPFFTMSGDGANVDDIKIPMVFLFNLEANELRQAITESGGAISVTIGDLVNENIRLIAPGDLSMFERLKSSVKEFLSRPVPLENSDVSSSSEIGHSKTSGSVDDKSSIHILSAADDKQDREMIIQKSHLRASISLDTVNTHKRIRNFVPLVRITTVGELPSSSGAVIDLEHLSVSEKTWRTIKQILVNQIHAGTKVPPNHVLSLTRLETYFDWLQKELNPTSILTSDHLTTFEIVSWFLNELSDTLPNSENSESVSSVLTPSQVLLQRLKPLLARPTKSPEQIESLFEMVESYKVYDSLLENIQDVLKNLKSEFYKTSKNIEDSKIPSNHNEDLVRSNADSKDDVKDVAIKQEHMQTEDIVKDDRKLKKAENNRDEL